MKTALITGVTGQDGSYLAELLLAKGYDVHGTKRRSSSFNTGRIDHLINHPDFHLEYCDLTDPHRLIQLIVNIQPDEIYNLAAQSDVRLSFDMPDMTAEATAMGTLHLLEAVRHFAPKARVYQASSSEQFGNVQAPQNLQTPFNPCSPYGVAKTFAHHLAVNYRQAHGLYIACGILFNHESPRRGPTFVTRKITRGLARIKAGIESVLVMGNLEAVRDWGYAPEYVEAMWMMLQREDPADLMIGTGKATSVRSFLYHCLKMADLPLSVVSTDAHYERPAELHTLQADPLPAWVTLGWRAKTHWRDLAEIMLVHDMALTGREVEQGRHHIARTT
jgi:GDPmannose 4,6-dehydratase